MNTKAIYLIATWLLAIALTAPVASAASGPEKTLKDSQEATEKLTELLTALATQPASRADGPDPSEQTSSSTPERAEPIVATGPSSAEVPASGAHVDASGMERRFERLLSGLASGTEPETRAELERFVRDYPQHALARYHLARLQISSGEGDAAQRLVGPLKSTHRGDWQAWFWSATAALSVGDLDTARLELDRALSVSGEHAEIWLQEAVLEQELGNHAGALQLLEVALAKAPDDAQVHLNMAYSLEHLNDRSRALAAYRNYLTASGGSNRSLRAKVLRRISELTTAG